MMHSTTITAAVFASLLAAVAVAAVSPPQDNLLDTVLDRCSLGPGAVGCLKSSVLEYLGGAGGRDARSLDSDQLDAELIKAAGAYVERQVSSYDVVGRAMDGDNNNMQQQQQQQQQQAATTTTTARADMEMGMMQDKMLMPLMMMMKMKLKMLMPIMMAMVSMKATKALVLSKVAIFLVLGFIIKEFLKKSGGIPGLPALHLPGLPGSDAPSSTAGPPPMMYGPPQSSGYESPASSWEPTGYSSGGSHSSSPSDSSHSMAYSSYLPSSSSSGSSGSSGSLSATKY